MFNGIIGFSLILFEICDIFKLIGLNGDLFVDEVEVKCEFSLIIQQEVVVVNGGVVLYLNELLYFIYIFNKLILDLENMGMVYGIFGFYLQGNGIIGLGFFFSLLMSQFGLLLFFMVVLEKFNGLIFGQQMVLFYGMQFFLFFVCVMFLIVGMKLLFVLFFLILFVIQVVLLQQQQLVVNGMI